MATQWLTIDEAAQVCGVHRRTVYRWLREGRLVVVRTPSGRVRIDAACLLREGAGGAGTATR